MTFKVFKLTIILALVLLMASCSSDTNRKKEEVKPVLQSDTIQKIKKLPSSRKNLGELFDNRQSFEIISFVKGTTSAFSFTDTTECKDWAISKKHLSEIIRNSESIAGITWDLAFNFHSCIITGELLQAKQKFEFEINAGSWMWIRCRDTALLLGDYNKADRKYFLSSPEIH
jgi:hypothetical protein